MLMATNPDLGIHVMSNHDVTEFKVKLITSQDGDEVVFDFGNDHKAAQRFFEVLEKNAPKFIATVTEAK